MTQDEIIEMAKQAGMGFNQSLAEFSTPLCDGVEIEELEAFAKLVDAKATVRVRKATLEEMIYSHPTEAIKKAVEYEREHCAKRASIALLGTLKSTSDRVLAAIRHRRGEA